MVSIITINYNNAGLTADLLKSIEVLQCTQLEVIVVDNGSRENVCVSLGARYPWARFIRSEKNLGFAGGNNLGIQHARGEYLFFINNDTEFKINIIPDMVLHFQRRPDLGILCPVIHYFDDPSVVQYAGYTPVNKMTGRNQCITTVDKAEPGQLLPTSYAHGAAMMIPRRVIDAVGLMPENYFLYYEELDWCESIKRAGYTISVDTNSIFYHKESRTVGAIGELKSYFMSRNRILFIRRNSGVLNLILFWSYFLLIVTPIQICRYIIRRQSANIRAHLAGIRWNFHHSKESTIIGYKFNYLNSHE